MFLCGPLCIYVFVYPCLCPHLCVCVQMDILVYIGTWLFPWPINVFVFMWPCLCVIVYVYMCYMPLSMCSSMCLIFPVCACLWMFLSACMWLYVHNNSWDFSCWRQGPAKPRDSHPVLGMQLYPVVSLKLSSSTLCLTTLGWWRNSHYLLHEAMFLFL